MGYGLGVDVGTTWTAAAIARPGSEPQVLALGRRAPVVPTVVHLGADGVVSVGETAERRAVADPRRVAREFKRRIGDTTPVLLGGQPWSPEALLVAVLRWVVGRATELEGEAPDAVVVTRPANWGPLRTELVEQAVSHAGITARFVTEPEAAAIHYASATRVPDGTVVAVYDLGGGTFDASVLRKLPAGFEVLGRPEGVERLGGLDFDAAVLGHVTGVLGSAWLQLDPEDSVAAAAVGRLRHDIVVAKEALSEDPDVAIPVQLPTVATEVRLTRAELEGMLRPSIEQSVDALERAIRGAGLSPADIDRILLVGGSSRIPLVSQVLGTRLQRPLALDAHPKHAVALGAARVAIADEGSTVSSPPAVPPAAAATPTPPQLAEAVPEPGPVPSSRRGLPRWVPVAGVLAVAAVVVGLLLAPGPDDDDVATDDGVDTTEAAGGSTGGDDVAAALVGLNGLAGSLISCAPQDGCIPGSRAGVFRVSVGCLVDGCSIILDGAAAADLEVFDDGVLFASGTAPDRHRLFCSGAPAATTFELTLETADQLTDLTGTLTFFAAPDAVDCSTTSETYDVAAFDFLDQARALEGDWSFAGAVTDCIGPSDEECAEAAAGFVISIACEDDGTCLVSISDAATEVFTVLDDGSLQASGLLSDAESFDCDGAPDPTTWTLRLGDSQLDAGGNPVGFDAEIDIQSQDGAIDGNACPGEFVAIAGTASPA